MTRKQRRAVFVGLGVGILSVAVFLVLFALRDYTVGFHFPKDVVEKQIPADRRIRLGGLVAPGSVKRGEGLLVQFGITDMTQTISVTYDKSLPDLFRECQGVIVEGRLDGTGRFVADFVLAKHDENYMPPEVAKGIKDQSTCGSAAPKAEARK
jgi:cytochrome c-type biogenesis protein CcmE